MTETPYRKLYRSRSDRMLAGVAGGIAEYSNIDPTLWVLVPEAPQQPAGWTPAAPTSPAAPSA
jgi:phage shock protein C